MSLYSIYVLEYARIESIPKSAVLYGAHNQGTVRLPYGYVVIKGENRIAMVDVGYNHKDYGAFLGEFSNVVNWHPPAEVLAPLGISPDDVTDVFITHAHFDHFGNVEAFPKATFYIQKKELQDWVWAMSLPSRLRWVLSGVDAGDILRAVQLAREGRLVTIDGSVADIVPGIDLNVAYDSHTFASMWVTVRNDGKAQSEDAWVLCGDLVYQYENLHGSSAQLEIEDLYLPLGMATGSQLNCIMAIEGMMSQVGFEARRIIPVHEDRLGQKFPSVKTEQKLRISEICLRSADTTLADISSRMPARSQDQQP